VSQIVKDKFTYINLISGPLNTIVIALVEIKI
jgi:hypothetical protein